LAESGGSSVWGEVMLALLGRERRIRTKRLDSGGGVGFVEWAVRRSEGERTEVRVEQISRAHMSCDGAGFPRVSLGRNDLRCT